jgi:hypothetical protein
VKTASLLFLLLACHGAGCAREPRRALEARTQPTDSVTTAEQAVEVIRRHIRKLGGDPAREEISAEWLQGEWHLVSWHIFYPNHKGASRFVPGGHTYYTVTPDGRVTNSMPGR